MSDGPTTSELRRLALYRWYAMGPTRRAEHVRGGVAGVPVFPVDLNIILRDNLTVLGSRGLVASDRPAV